MQDQANAPEAGDAFLSAETEGDLLSALSAEEDGDDSADVTQEAAGEQEPAAPPAKAPVTEEQPAWARALVEQQAQSQKALADAMAGLAQAIGRIGQPAAAPAPVKADPLEMARKGDWSELLRSGLGDADPDILEAAALSRLREKWADHPELLAQIDATQRRAVDKLGSQRTVQSLEKQIAELRQQIESDKIAREFPKRLRDNRATISEQWPTVAELVDPHSTAVSDYIAARVGFHDRDAVASEMTKLESQLGRVGKAMASEPGEAERMARYLSMQSPEMEPFYMALAAKHKAQAPTTAPTQTRNGKKVPPQTSTRQSAAGTAPTVTTDIERFHAVKTDRELLEHLSRPVPGEPN